MLQEVLAGPFWQGVLSQIRGRVSEQQFDTWFRGVQPGTCSEDVLELTVPNSFSKEWLRKKYADLILGAVESANGGRRPTLRIVVREGGETAGGAPSIDPVRGEPLASDALGDGTDGGGNGSGSLPRSVGATIGLHPRPFSSLPPSPLPAESASLVTSLNRDFRFANFVVGAGNRMSSAAAESVIDKEARVYNPLFVHGGVGLGKTHLLQAICHAIIEKRPEKRVLYLPCELFVNQFIAAVEKGGIETFRARIREVDVLVIDDLQFLAQKERTQEEFFHSFNFLYNRGRQIILSADRAPGEIAGLSERLISRCKWGLICELEAPEFEARLEIVRRKAARFGVALADDVASYVAEHVRTNVRELEGAVTRIVGHAHLSGTEITIDSTRETLRDVVIERKRKVTMDHISKAVIAHFGAKLAELQSKRRTQAIAGPRQICMFLARRLTGHSLDEIGGYFGGRDHSTVLYGIERTESKAREDGEFRSLVETLGAQALQVAAS